MTDARTDFSTLPSVPGEADAECGQGVDLDTLNLDFVHCLNPSFRGEMAKWEGFT